MFQTWHVLTITLLTVLLLTAAVVIVRLRQQLARARHDATHDSTTGLPNRRAVTTYLRTALRHGDAIGLILLDLDGFKTLNDTYGHERGNDVLTEIGHRLTALPGTALVARLSGDEFALIVAGDRDQTAATAHAAGIAVAARPVRLGTETVPVVASVGYATATLGSTGRQLLHTADLAMYQAKTYGHGAVYGAPAAVEHPGIGRGPRYRDLRHRTTDPIPPE